MAIINDGVDNDPAARQIGIAVTQGKMHLVRATSDQNDATAQPFLILNADGSNETVSSGDGLVTARQIAVDSDMSIFLYNGDNGQTNSTVYWDNVQLIELCTTNFTTSGTLTEQSAGGVTVNPTVSCCLQR